MNADNADGNSVTIEIETPDAPLAFAMKDVPPQGVSVFVPPLVRMRESFGGHDLITFTLTVTAGVSAKVISSWICSKFKSGRSPTIKINRRVTELKDDKITRIIEESMTVSNTKGPEE